MVIKIIKLKNGDTLIANLDAEEEDLEYFYHALPTIDDENETIIPPVGIVWVIEPLKIFEKMNFKNGKISIFLADWIAYSSEESHPVFLHSIVTITSPSEDILQMYNSFLTARDANRVDETEEEKTFSSMEELKNHMRLKLWTPPDGSKQ